VTRFDARSESWQGHVSQVEGRQIPIIGLNPIAAFRTAAVSLPAWAPARRSRSMQPDRARASSRLAGSPVGPRAQAGTAVHVPAGGRDGLGQLVPRIQNLRAHCHPHSPGGTPDGRSTWLPEASRVFFTSHMTLMLSWTLRSEVIAPYSAAEKRNGFFSTQLPTPLTVSRLRGSRSAVCEAAAARNAHT